MIPCGICVLENDYMWNVSESGVIILWCGNGGKWCRMHDWCYVSDALLAMSDILMCVYGGK